ncbi:MAG: DegV family EDD domain-containing protein [Erysipelotrichaceae bacterium]|nr:DegV family EDD domain-containing protein [Erysipelotrichaceae bacterium]
MEWGIVADSSCELKLKDIENNYVDTTIVPLSFVVGDKNFVDTDDQDPKEMLEAMKACKDEAKSACPSPAAFEEAFRKSKKVICITVTSGLSGTYNSALVGKGMAEEEDPDIQIHVVDSHATGGLLALLIYKCLELMKPGVPFEEVVEKIDEYNRSLKLIFCLGSYENLIKTGRMNPFVGGIVERLNIKVYCTNNYEGQIVMGKKAKGTKAIYRLMVERMMEEKDITNLPVVISHCQNQEGAELLASMIQEQMHPCRIEIIPCKCLCSFYTLEGGVIVGY